MTVFSNVLVLPGAVIEISAKVAEKVPLPTILRLVVESEDVAVFPTTSKEFAELTESVPIPTPPVFVPTIHITGIAV